MISSSGPLEVPMLAVRPVVDSEIEGIGEGTRGFGVISDVCGEVAKVAGYPTDSA